MLSFFKSKIPQISLEKIVDGTNSLNMSSESFQSKTANEILSSLGYQDENDLRETIYGEVQMNNALLIVNCENRNNKIVVLFKSDILRTIRDPEKPSTLEDLNVVYEEGIFVQSPTNDNVQVVRVEFNPTVPHCSLATLIGLCIRIKIERNIPHKMKLDIYIKKGAHSTEDESKLLVLK